MTAPEKEPVADLKRHLVIDASDQTVRSYEIQHLPAVEWKGRTLRTITCHGTSGKGHHRVNVPESLLWQLMSVHYFMCPYHA